MISDLLSIIQREDKRNPMKDDELAKILDTNREKINLLRQENNIPNYLERRESYLIENIDNIIISDPQISLRKITSELNKLGFKISTFGVRKYKEYIDNKKREYLKREEFEFVDTNDAANKIDDFSNVIGALGSLRQVIKLAKASVLYPPNGLHTLLFGETGVGKSQLVEEIYNYAKTIRKNRNMPLITLNCADYSDNPQLIVSQLFGYSKGSFTGADKDRQGLVEKANEGILFLDEIHRLPPKGQEILFRIIDKGEFSRLGETSRIRKVNIMIIGATTENLESNLLITFRRRIPVLIEIPPLKDRPMKERLQLIYKFFSIEAAKLNCSIKLSEKILEILLFYKCTGNIGQLKSDVQVICAKAFLKLLSEKEDIIKITIKELPNHIKNQVLDISNKRDEHNLLGLNDITIVPNNKDIEKQLIKHDIGYLMKKRIDEIKKTEEGLKEKKNLVKELNTIVENYTNSIEKKYGYISKKDLKNFLGIDITQAVEYVLKEINIDEKLKQSLFNILSLHINSAVERLMAGNIIINPQLDNIKRNNKKEFEIALRLANILNEKLDITVPEDEAGFIALYLIHYIKKNRNYKERRVKVVVVTHGQVADSMLKVAQALLGINDGIAISMELSVKPREILEKVKDTITKVHEGKGVLLLVDMGSLVSFEEIISEELGVKVKAIPRVDTLMVIEAIRKASISSNTLEGVYDSILELDRMVSNSKIRKWDFRSKPKSKAIITTCITGKGTALKIKEVIKKKLGDLSCGIDIIPVGLLDGDFLEKILEIEKDYEILLIVGTVDPEYKNLIFIPFEKILDGEKLDFLLNAVKLSNNSIMKNNGGVSIKDLFDSKAIKFFDSCRSKEELIANMVDTLVHEGYVKKEFYNDVMEREEDASSYIGDNVAIPHTTRENSIIRPIIGVGILKKPLLWDDGKVNIVLMLALTPKHKNNFLKIYKLIKGTDLNQKIKKLNNGEDVIKEVLKYARRK
ncbi:sigma 54-interacting transcriptional regulator [Maledivibacter halophilus]|uniref:Transcriptional regulator containing an AAA-type ATPase domain and a DNA-binding domain n=1 Tax=Maledivibacter halophilus TaxID=36842 RepID=A0A1T5JTP5_9FIRM|nr:sigma 54-interacting transcriptional regulator [Maledivibacter halophilus]SKC54734.1 Transcriptional regulator containing an AAA-type ATPase domain and a DNA-binding domain [Maledivibacter halophilus]